MNDGETNINESLESMSNQDSAQFSMPNVSEVTLALPGVPAPLNGYKSSQAQGARKIRLSFEQLNNNEQMVVAAMAEHGRPIRTIRDIGKVLNWHKGRGNNHAKANSRVRNTLRRLVQSGWLAHESETGDGTYRLPLAAYQRLYVLSQKLKSDPEAKDAAVEPELDGTVTELVASPEAPAEVPAEVVKPAEVQKPEPTPEEVGF